MKKPVEEIVDDYLNLIQPHILITKMTNDEFEDWLSLDLLEDKDMYLESLKLTLKAFEAQDLYEHCRLIKNKIDKFLVENKKDV